MASSDALVAELGFTIWVVVAVFKLACAVEELDGVSGIEVLLCDIKFGWEMGVERCRGRENPNFKRSRARYQLLECHRLGSFA